MLETIFISFAIMFLTIVYGFSNYILVKEVDMDGLTFWHFEKKILGQPSERHL